MKTSYYSLNNILKEKPYYNFIYGARSYGRNTKLLFNALKDYINSGYKNKFIIRTLTDKDIQQMFENIGILNLIKELTKGKYNGIYYYSQICYLCRYDDLGNIEEQSDDAFAICFSDTIKFKNLSRIKGVYIDEK